MDNANGTNGIPPSASVPMPQESTLGDGLANGSSTTSTSTSTSTSTTSTVFDSLKSLSSLSGVLSKTISVPSSLMPHTQQASVQISKIWTSAKPWKEFFDTKKLHKPASLSEVQDRLMDNLTYFSSNYVLFFLVISCLSVLIHPLSFLCIMSLVALYVYMFLQHPGDVKIGPVKLQQQTKLVVYLFASCILLYLTNAIAIIGSWAVFSIILSICHAAFRVSIKEPDFESPIDSV